MNGPHITKFASMQARATTTPLDTIGNTPLFELDGLRPKGGGRIYGKWEAANPTGSMKDRMAIAMIRSARREGKLQPGQPVVEYTGGSTGSSLAFVCAVLGHPLYIVTADCFSEEKTRTMRAFGAHVEVLVTPDGVVYPGLGARYLERASAIRDEHDAYWANQINNPHQVDGYVPMGREILTECPQITDFAMGVGGGGCIMGNARAFQEAGLKVRILALEPAEAPYISSGVAEGTHDVEGISVFPRPQLRLFDADRVDGIRGVPEAEARAMARRLACEFGLLVGTSSGMNVVAARTIARERGPDSHVVVPLVDSGAKYLHGGLFDETRVDPGDLAPTP